MTLLVYLISLLQFLTGADDVSLVFAGDAMQHERQIKAAAVSGGGHDYKACFRHVADYVGSADYAVVNLECPLGGKPYAGYPCFSAPDEFAEALRGAGFDLFLQANNHCLDRRDKGLRRTLDRLDEMGIPHTGTFRNADDRKQRQVFLTTIKDIRFAFLNYTYGTNGIQPNGTVVNYIDKPQMRADIAAARKQGAEMVVVCIHWGVEYKLIQNREQEQLADFLVGEGVDMVIGGHPHVIQPMEIRRNAKTRKDVLVVYSLGNFISAMRTTDTRGGAMVKVAVGRDGEGRPYLKGAEYKLVFVQQPTGNGNFELIPADKTELLRDDMKPYFRKFTENAYRIFDKYNVNVPEDWKVPLKSDCPLVPADDKL